MANTKSTKTKGRPKGSKTKAKIGGKLFSKNDDVLPILAESYEERQSELRRMLHPVHLSDGKWDCRGMLIPDCDELTALLFSFRNAETPEQAEYYYWECANTLWNSDPDPEEHLYRRNKWSWKIIHECCHERYVAFGGSASSGKSYVMAGWCIINFLADPANTLILVTSTDLKGARSRIYGAIRRLLSVVPDPPCRIKDAVGVIAYDNGDEVFETSGIRIVTADKSKSENAVGKLVGYKSPRLILVADEHGEMGMNVQNAATGNLAKNPHFQMVSLSNPSSRFDPFGVFVEPQGGWDSVDVFEDYEWTTRLNGKYVRLNSEHSPNIDTELSIHYPVGAPCPGIITQDMIDADLDAPGMSEDEVRKSRNFMRFHSAVFHDGDETETVYIEGELMRAGATGTSVIHKPTLIAGCDPSYSDQGDSTVLLFAEEGFDQYGQHAVQIKEFIYVNEDITNKADSRSVQIANKIKIECEKRGVKPENLGIDATSGAGMGICDMLQLQWDTNMFLRVQFGGAASKKRISPHSKVLACERYKNRATELFFSAKYYLMGKQLYGIPPIIAKQMCQRLTLEPTKGKCGLMYQVEPKREYKARIGSSPDELDAYLVCIETALTRRMFTPTEAVPRNQGQDIGKFLRSRRSHTDYAADRMGFVGNI